MAQRTGDPPTARGWYAGALWRRPGKRPVTIGAPRREAQALGVAYEAELQASMYYDAFADNLEGQPAAFFRALAKTEEEHAKAVDARPKAQ